MIDILEAMGHVYQGIRAFHDAGGMQMIVDQQQRQEFIDAFMTSKGIGS